MLAIPSAADVPASLPTYDGGEPMAGDHPECINCCLAGWRQTENFRDSFVPSEVICPFLLLRVKQGDGLT
jgi:hypothetical protein